MKRRYRSAFTLAEMLVTMSVASVVGGIIYAVASEGLSSFANNASINRTYTDARGAIFQINSAIKSAGHVPQLLDSTGAVATPAPSPTPTYGKMIAPGVRFYRSGNLPSYLIPSGTSTDSSLTLTFSTGQAIYATPPVLTGDLATIPLLGFQDTVISTSGYTHNANGTGTITLNFAKPIYQNCTPALAVDSNKATIPVAFTPSGTNPVTYYTCLVFRQVAFIAVPNSSNGADLRYYPQAMSAGTGSACGNLAAFNNSAAFNNPQNFSVLATIPTNTVTTADTTTTPIKPFSIYTTLSPAVLGVSLGTTSPDYSNRSLRPSNSFSVENCSMSSRSPILLHLMSVPF